MPGGHGLSDQRHRRGDMTDRPKLESCTTRYFGFGARAPLPILGQFTSRVEFASRSTNAGFIVLRGATEQLIGHHTARILEMSPCPRTASSHE